MALLKSLLGNLLADEANPLMREVLAKLQEGAMQQILLTHKSSFWYPGVDRCFMKFFFDLGSSTRDPHFLFCATIAFAINGVHVLDAHRYE